MRKLLLLIAAPAMLLAMQACSSAEKSADNAINASEAISVEQAVQEARPLVDSIVSIKGKCVHICDYSAYNAYLMGPDSSIIRCVASTPIGGYFPAELENKEVVFKGMLRDQHIDIEGVHNLDEQYRMHVQILRDYNLDDESQMLDSHRRCEYERMYRGQQGITYFDESTGDYRKRIEKRMADEGKDYLTFFYLEVTDYQPVE